MYLVNADSKYRVRARVNRACKMDAIRAKSCQSWEKSICTNKKSIRVCWRLLRLAWGGKKSLYKCIYPRDTFICIGIMVQLSCKSWRLCVVMVLPQWFKSVWHMSEILVILNISYYFNTRQSAIRIFRKVEITQFGGGMCNNSIMDTL